MYDCSAKRLHFYGKKAAVRNANATISGEKILLMGPNGSGKTTLLRAIAGIIPYQGSIKVDDEEVSRIKNHNYLATNLPEVFCIGVKLKDIIYVYEELKNVDGTLAREMLKDVGITELNKKIYELSAGQQILFRNCLALASKPKILLMDEPFENVDVAKRKTVVGWIMEFGKEGIIVTHEIDMAKLFITWKASLILEGKLYKTIGIGELLSLSLQKGAVPDAILVIEVGENKFSLVKGEGYKVEDMSVIDKIYML
ncbi:ATP-binding cassette domain-containing protein [Candidatus Bathyarchaeota archaeon]|nr:ATP-binding cassette domain-containing protein [Candidatus Bathyarchaeota archaeon]